MMKVFRKPVKEAYKDLGVQRYQIFTMSEKKPGVVSCRVGPANQPPLQPPPPNFEKKQQMYNKGRPYAPSEIASDPLYAAPTDKEERHAKKAKQARHSASAKKKKIDAAICDEAKVAPVDCKEENEDHANVSKATSAQPKTGTRSRKRAKKDN
ncbi:H/ACA ribonucleoprotein complex non-core subunit NAF1 [Phytophthora nicotianae]|uniref:H/ACA ribonucleoprotein complex non-core subunit NAF1 n=1 Tax=Phytophthora nicotianae TaxID=4792 RepID=A0A0W8D6Z0_PHYNI|nr:H/ACA ribonucleoprotein complex non-core subunit NAF1 [Phytophthora nicotianae]